MTEEEAKEFLKKDLNFQSSDIEKLEIFIELLLRYNSKYNLISKSTEKTIWNRHILDSAQLIKYFSNQSNGYLVDFGSGAGFPGLILAIFNKNPDFHVKLYEKSPVKRNFLMNVKEKLNIVVDIGANIHDEKIKADIIVCRAFKKLDQIMKISREIGINQHKIIILKGKNAQSEINKVSIASNYSYKLEDSVTDNDSKIIVIKVG